MPENGLFQNNWLFCGLLSTLSAFPQYCQNKGRMRYSCKRTTECEIKLFQWSTTFKSHHVNYGFNFNCHHLINSYFYDLSGNLELTAEEVPSFHQVHLWQWLQKSLHVFTRCTIVYTFEILNDLKLYLIVNNSKRPEAQVPSLRFHCYISNHVNQKKIKLKKKN